MKSKIPFEEMSEDEYIFGKLTNDGGDVHLFFEEQNLPKGKKRVKIPEKRVDVDVTSLEIDEESEENYGGIIASEHALKTPPSDDENKQDGQVVEESEEAQNKPNKTVKMTLRELFNHYYDAYSKYSWQKRWALMMDRFAHYIPDYGRRKDFLAENFKRKRHNLNARKKPFFKKMLVKRYELFCNLHLRRCEDDGRTIQKEATYIS